MKYDGIIFDLDGTLWNSTPANYICWKETAEKWQGLRSLSYQDVLDVMGLSDITLTQKLFPELDDEQAQKLFDQVTAYENEYLGANGAETFEGIYETLETLSKNHKICIVSNCGKGYIEAYLKSMSTKQFISDFESFGNTKKPKSENIKSVVKRNNFKNAVYIGDTIWDMQSAISAGVDFIHASYGFGSFNCDFPKIEKPLDLLNLIGD